MLDGGIESALAALDGALDAGERQAGAALGQVRRLRRLCKAGDLAGLASQLAQAPGLAERLADTLRTASAGPAYAAETAFADGSYLAELRAEAARQGVVLSERDGRVTAFPFLLKLDGRVPGVKIGRKLHRGIRPSALVKVLAAAQAAAKFNARAFLEQVWKAYAVLAPGVQPGWTANSAGEGPVVGVLGIHEVLTLLPAAASEYPRDAFACDLLRLNRAPDTTTGRGLGFTLPASTGSKGRERLTAYDEAGEEHVFVGIRFLPGARGSHVDAG
ncbi:MAG: hypothetical protein BGP12_04260 [Rhodospirillales bacterium 70-18]|nr:MAG: hypothetical protein BGP12_04260 [Rhodospirillales bacterium 70-18]